MNNDKNSVEQLHPMRHTLAHLLAAAVLELYPGTKNTIGPSIDTGFYYDFEFPKDAAPTEKDLGRIEQKMREILKSWKEFTHQTVTGAEAQKHFAGNQYKEELIADLVKEKQEITFYTSGTFTDLCRGGHVENPAKDIPKDAWKLSRIAGAYWRGDEKNAMLTRIYGLAFATKADLAAHEAKIEEAKKRDHKKLGKELDLFTFSDLVGAGLPLWTPRGYVLRQVLDDFVWSLRGPQGYVRVEIPHITKKELYMTSGHWDKYQNDLFKIKTREGHEFVMKPMNCPHHTQIFARRMWSYREMPQRYANTTTCYRDEQSGELSGLSRVRALTQDDAHVFCRLQQVKDEFLKIWDIIHTFYPVFGFKLQVRLSRHDPEHPEKYLGDAKNWETAENLLKEIIKEKGVEAIDGKGEAAFYGPKLDFMANDSLGREWQVATIQLDFNMPNRFELTCTNEKGEKEPVVMIHAAIMGSIDRFLSIVIEHYAGNFPTWLAPTQVVVIPIGEAHHAEAAKVHASLQAAGIRSELDTGSDGFGKKVRAAKVMKIPYFIIIGDKDIAEGKVTLESRDKGQLGQMKAEEVLSHLSAEIKERK